MCEFAHGRRKGADRNLCNDCWHSAQFENFMSREFVQESSPSFDNIQNQEPYLQLVVRLLLHCGPACAEQALVTQLLSVSSV